MGRAPCFDSIGQEKSMKKLRKTWKKVNADALAIANGRLTTFSEDDTVSNTMNGIR
jgi:hypothetical protein